MTDCQGIEPIGWRHPRATAEPASAQRTAYRHLDHCVAVDPMLAGIRFPGAPSRLRPGDFVGLDRPGKQNESLASDRRGKLPLSNVYAPNACKALA